MKTINIDGAHISAEHHIRLHEVAKLIYKARRATVLTGAGISCNAGIPDFRSEDGLYNIVKAKYPTSFIKGQDLFDISLFRSSETLSIFGTFMEGLYTYSLQAKATETHRFIKTLKEKNKLLRCYTQNIDSIEKTLNLNCGIDSSNFNELQLNTQRSFRQSWSDLDVVQLHGNLHKLSCTQCQTHYEWTSDSQSKLREGEYPECDNCLEKYQERLYSGKRLTGNIGILRPNIVLYGENHPQSEILAKGLNLDMSLKSDLVIIMGTSLKVDGVKKLVRAMCKNVHERGGKVLFVNKTSAPKQFAGLIDFEVLGDCDEFVRALRNEIPDLFLTQEQLDSKKLQSGVSKKVPSLKLEAEVVAAIKAESYYETIEKRELFTPPATPSKRRIVELPCKRKPKLNRGESKRMRLQRDLPSPCSSFSEVFKVELESDVATDTDECEVTVKKEEGFEDRVRPELKV